MSEKEKCMFVYIIILNYLFVSRLSHLQTVASSHTLTIVIVLCNIENCIFFYTIIAVFFFVRVKHLLHMVTVLLEEITVYRSLAS